MIARLMGLRTVDPATLHRRMQNERIAVFDLNSRASWLAARIPGARHLDPQAELAEVLPPEPDQPLVFYCSNPFCRKAPLAARKAEKLGHRQVQVLAAGISGWLAAGMPSESGG